MNSWTLGSSKTKTYKREKKLSESEKKNPEKDDKQDEFYGQKICIIFLATNMRLEI